MMSIVDVIYVSVKKQIKFDCQLLIAFPWQAKRKCCHLALKQLLQLMSLQWFHSRLNCLLTQRKINCLSMDVEGEFVEHETAGEVLRMKYSVVTLFLTSHYLTENLHIRKLLL